MNVALYARVSREQCRKCGKVFEDHADADHDFSGQDPEAQLQPLREMCRSRGWTISREYVDQGFSGAKESRPALDELMRDVERGYRYFDAICVWKFDRFARSTKQLIDALEEFRHLGVDFISITEQIDTGSPMGKAMFTVISAIAEFERSLISERVRSGIAKARAQGKILGRPKVSAETIKEIKRLRKEGKSLTQIAKQLGVSYQTVANYS